jgi:hypothetical protein
MPIDRRILLIALPLLLAGCEHDFAGIAPVGAAPFGEPNRQTMMAQIVDPDPQYETQNPPTSGLRAGQAGERYRTDAVKKPDRVTSTQTSSGSGGGGGR